MAGPYPFTPQQPPSPSRRWIPVAVVAAALAGAGVATAVVVGNHRTDTSPAVGQAEGTTCTAWRQTRAALKAIPELPANWTWDTPNIHVLIANHSALVTRALDALEPQIRDEPAAVAAAARTFVTSRRREVLLLANRTYKRSDGKAGDDAFVQLNQLCNVTAT